MAERKMYFAYRDVHAAVVASASSIQEAYKPDVIVAIGGGGFIPARMFRSILIPFTR